MIRSLTTCLALTCAFGAVADPLFEDDSILEIGLAGPYERIERERDKAASYDGTLHQGSSEYNVALQVRGNKRLSDETCKYPPLRIDFKKKEIKDTLFDKQDDIKLVVQCKNGSLYEGYLRTEYLVYKSFNLLTDASYRVRWANVNYTDTEDKGESRSAPAFFVERKSRLAKRLDLDTTDVISVGVEELVAEDAAMIGLFQYLIANPDYSIRAAPPGEACCHNAKVLVRKDNRYVPIIYDFDSSGVINARYAVPAEGLGIRKVTQRVYRGYCEHNDAAIAAREEILAKKDEILALFSDDPLLGERASKSAVKFLTRSFDILSNEAKFASEIIEECR